MGFGKDGKGVMIIENGSINFSTLGGATAIFTPGPALTDNFRTVKIDAHLVVTGLASNEGVQCGISQKNLTVAEVAAALTPFGPKFRGDTDDEEKSSRPVFALHTFIEGDEKFAHIEKTLRWTWGEDTAGWNWWAFNPSAGALTTGAALRVQCKSFGVWV